MGYWITFFRTQSDRAVTLVKTRDASGAPCARPPPHKITLMWDNKKPADFAQGGLWQTFTQNTPRIIDPCIMDYFFSHSGRPCRDARED
jgi:hypothetical protein